METTFKQLADFLVAQGTDKVAHTEAIYLAHAIGVHNDLRDWGCDEDVCRAGMFHSIYGTELFQDFTLPLERRDDVRRLIGERAEKLSYLNCAMDRATYDAAVQRGEVPFQFRDRLTTETVELSEQDFHDLGSVSKGHLTSACRVPFCNFLGLHRRISTIRLLCPPRSERDLRRLGPTSTI